MAHEKQIWTRLVPLVTRARTFPATDTFPQIIPNLLERGDSRLTSKHRFRDSEIPGLSPSSLERGYSRLAPAHR